MYCSISDISIIQMSKHILHYSSLDGGSFSVQTCIIIKKKIELGTKSPRNLAVFCFIGERVEQTRKTSALLNL